MSSPQATHCLRILGCNKAVLIPSQKRVRKKEKSGKKKKKVMLVVTASSTFTTTAGFSGSFTKPEAGKCANNTPNQGLYFSYLE